MPPKAETGSNAEPDPAAMNRTGVDRDIPAAHEEFPSYPAHTRVTMMLVSSRSEDHEFFSSLFQPPHWYIYRANSYREALNWMVRDHMGVIVCECDLPDGNWKDILSQAQVLPDPPYVVVAAQLADELLWAEVLNLGGYDLLAKPFVREEVMRVAELASLSWKRGVEDGIREEGKNAND